jgi:hypothetical protein
VLLRWVGSGRGWVDAGVRVRRGFMLECGQVGGGVASLT